jgi:rRNA biogenesis protein RRP5
MSSLKRKEAPGGSRPPKRPKSDDFSKDKDSSKHSAKKHKASKDATPKKPPKDAAAPTLAAPTVSLLQADAPLFPRGGASVLTPLEQKEIQVQAKKDALFEEQSAAAGGAKGDKSGKKKKRKSEVDAESAFDPDAVKAEGLNYKVRGLPALPAKNPLV